MGCSSGFLVSSGKCSMMLCSYLRLFVFIFTFTLVASAEFFPSFLQNPGKGVNFYGKIQSDPVPSESSAKSAYDNLIGVYCPNASNDSSCERDILYHYPGIECQIESIPCNFSYPYRTYDGSCNNLKAPKFGMKNQCYRRFLPAFYEGYGGFRKSVTGAPLPPPRELTVKIFKDRHMPIVNVSSQFASFAEYAFLDFLKSVKKFPDCCAEENADNPSCQPILISPDDPFYSQFNHTCNTFFRTVPCSCKTLKRSQTNGVSAHMDESQLYGLSEEDVRKARTMDGTGRLKPQVTDSSAESFSPKDEEMTCYSGSDPRTTGHAILSSHVTIFKREHNRIAVALKQINPHWGEEKLFQEARKILNAEHQYILFKDFLPILLSPRIVEEFGLTVSAGTGGLQYNSSVIPGIFNEFAISSFRLHSLLPRDIGVLKLRVKDTYKNPVQLCQRHLTAMMKGLRHVHAEQNDRYAIEDITDYLFQKPGVPYGMDLTSITIQRGRDHGLAPYVEVVKFCSVGKVLIKSFEDLHILGLMPKSNADLLKQIYAAVEDIDMTVGLPLEKPMPGSVTGPSTVCINAKQFYFIQKGDRFYFDLVGPEASFTDDQRQALKHCSWARFLCDNTDISHVTKNPFIIPSDENPTVSCTEIPTLDLMLWKDNDSRDNVP